MFSSENLPGIMAGVPPWTVEIMEAPADQLEIALQNMKLTKFTIINIFISVKRATDDFWNN